MEALAWPLAVVVIVVVFLLMFRAPLARLLDRAKDLRIAGTHVAMTEPQKPDEQSTTEPGENPRPLQAWPDDPVIAATKEHLVRSLSLDSVTSASEREQLLMAAAAQSNAAWICERIYRLIFGSQIDALQYLNSDSPADREVIQIYFDAAATAHPDVHEGRTYEVWLGFLISWKLVQVVEDEISISLLGRFFLQYVTQQGLSLQRPS